MKRTTFYLSLLILGTFLSLATDCDLNSLEECEQDEICTGKFVTACCNDVECYYMYNGKKYGDDAASLEQLARDLGCTFVGMADYDSEIQDIVLRLTALKEFTKSNLIEKH